MKKQALFYGMGSLLALTVLILDGKTALIAAQAGISLCLHALIPSLFPFLFLTGLMMEAMHGTDSRFLHFPGKLWKLPENTEGLLIPAFLGGYPVGARCIRQACSSGRMAHADAGHLMAWCNNPGPAFLFGILPAFFGNLQAVWALWGIQLLGAFTVCRLMPGANCIGKAAAPEPIRPAQILNDAIGSMLKICGWVILFRILVGFLDGWFLHRFPAWLRVCLVGMLELSNGCCALGTINDPQIRFIICCGMLSFGGLCIFLQIASVAENIPLGFLFRGKLLQTGICLLLGAAYAFRMWWIFLCWTGFLILLTGKRQKRSSIPVAAAV